MHNPACPFCIPLVENACFAESQNFRAVYNIAPVLPGHVLIVPKTHLVRFLELEVSMLTEMVQFSRKVIQTLELAFKIEAFDWTIQDGKAAGQTVEHFHLHIIPRTEGDLPEPGDWYPKLKNSEACLLDSFSRPKFTTQEVQEISWKLSQFFQFL